MILSLALWLLITLCGSASIILILRFARTVIRICMTNPEQNPILIAINKKSYLVDSMAVTVSISVSAGGKVLELMLNRNHPFITIIFTSLLMIIIISAGLLAVWFESEHNKESFKATSIYRFALFGSALACLIGISVHMIMALGGYAT